MQRTSSFLSHGARLAIALLLGSLAACATPEKAVAWPEPVVGVDQMKIVDNIRVKTTFTSKTYDKERDYTVVLLLLVDTEGKVSQQKIHTASGHPYLDEAALQAARTTRFAPHVVDGQAIPVTVVMPMHFRLKPPA